MLEVKPGCDVHQKQDATDRPQPTSELLADPIPPPCRIDAESAPITGDQQSSGPTDQGLADHEWLIRTRRE